jgi:tetratricopeptide (TPR) repeat protein
MELNKNEKKRLNDDLKKIEKNLVSDPHNSKFLYEKGVILEKLGNYRSAYTAYSMAHTYDPAMVMKLEKMSIKA